MEKPSDCSTITAISTPMGYGGIGIIKISGPSAKEIATQLFHPYLREENPQCSVEAFFESMQSHRLYYGQIKSNISKEFVDQVLLVFMKGPHSYTGEDVVEINSHSGPVLTTRILELVVACGARLADPGEFTQRAFLNGRIDLTQAESVIDVISAKSRKALSIAGTALKGDFKQRMTEIEKGVKALLIPLEAAIDFGEEIPGLEHNSNEQRQFAVDVIKKIERLILSYTENHFYHDGIRISVIGKPNVGKSSILNRLSRRERAIVSEIPGTTRDAIEEAMIIKGIPVTVVDTAGMHASENTLEIAGIRMARKSVLRSDAVFFVVDASKITTEDHEIYSELHERDPIIIYNKIDLVPAGEAIKPPPKWEKHTTVNTSALYDHGMEDLKTAFLKKTMGDIQADQEPLVPNLRQKIALEGCLKNARAVQDGLKQQQPPELIVFELQGVLDGLGSIIGKTTREETIQHIFDNFCIGK